MKDKLLTLAPYIAALIINFYVIPLLILNTGLAIFIVIYVIPAITFICSVIYGLRQGFDLWLLLTALILFTPTIFIFYNFTALTYIPKYAIIILVGNGIGRAFYKER